MNISYSPEAIEDLKRLREFIAVKSPLAAQRIANELLTGIHKLKVFPKMGLSVTKAPDPELIRDLFIGQYTVRYFYTGIDIIVLRFWHDKENEKNL